MSRKRRAIAAEDPEFQGELEDRIQRLREMLVLMAPDARSRALGATIPMYEPAPRGQLLLPSPDAAANF